MRRTPRPAILRMASPTRAPRLGAIAPSSFALSPSVATFEALARCSAPSPNARSFSPWSKVNAPATARRPPDGIAMPRPALRAIAPCSGIGPSACEKVAALATSDSAALRLPARSRRAPSAAALPGLNSSAPFPCRLALLSQARQWPDAPLRRSSLRSRKRSIAASRSGFGRMAESGSLPIASASTPASLIGLGMKNQARTKNAFSRIARTTDLHSRPLQTMTIGVEMPCHEAPRCCGCPDDRAMQPHALTEDASERRRLVTPVHAFACGSVISLL